MDIAAKGLAAFGKYLGRKPEQTDEDVVKSFTFFAGFLAGHDAAKAGIEALTGHDSAEADIEALIELLGGALTCAPSLLNMPIGTKISAAITRHRERGTIAD